MSDGATIRTKADEVAKAGKYADLAANIAANLELGGASRLPWIEANFLRTMRRNIIEIEPVLLALSVQGTADGAARAQTMSTRTAGSSGNIRR